MDSEPIHRAQLASWRSSGSCWFPWRSRSPGFVTEHKMTASKQPGKDHGFGSARRRLNVRTTGKGSTSLGEPDITSCHSLCACWRACCSPDYFSGGWIKVDKRCGSLSFTELQQCEVCRAAPCPTFTMTYKHLDTQSAQTHNLRLQNAAQAQESPPPLQQERILKSFPEM